MTDVQPPAPAPDLRQLAWNNVIHAEGTRAVFARRYAALRRWTRVRDVLGLVIPIIVAFLFTTDWVQKFAAYKTLALAFLSFAALAQGLIVVWSILSKWDEELAYSTRAMRDSADIRESWRDVGQGLVADIPQSFAICQTRQRLLDSHDDEKGITAWEMQLGMRAGLIACQRNCRCGELPHSRKPPRTPAKACIICGGN